MESTAPVTHVFVVPEANLQPLRSQIAKLNRRALKIRCPLITMTESVNRTERAYINATGTDGLWITHGQPIPSGMVATGVVRVWHDVTINGTAPKFNGWSFIATLEPLDADGEQLNIILVVPGEKCPGEFLRRVGVCDHCKARRNRKQTFVVRHDDGRCIAVGRQCIKDFLGHADPLALAGWAELLCSLGGVCADAEKEDWLGGGGRAEARFSIDRFLAQTAAACRLDGYVSRKAARARCDDMSTAGSTADNVVWLIDPPKFGSDHDAREHREEKKRLEPTDADVALADEALEWALAMDIDALAESDGNGYLLNVAAVARAGNVTRKTAGIAASIISAMNRERVRAEESKAMGPSEHVGITGRKVELSAKFLGATAYEGPYGVTWVTRFAAHNKATDAYSDDVVWFASSRIGMSIGECGTVMATVKSHGVRNGRKQTVITRAKVLVMTVAPID